MLRNIILICSTIILIGCSENKHELNKIRIKDAKTFGEQFTLAIEFVNDTLFYDIIKILNDSITASPHSKALITTILWDIEKEELLWHFEDCGSCLPEFSENNSFIVKVLDKDTMLIDGKYGKQDDVYEMIRKFYNRHDSIGSSKWKYKITNEFFKDVEIPKTLNIIIYELKNRNKLTIEEWKGLFNVGNNIIDYYTDKCDKIALNKWGINYNELCIEKKLAVEEVAGCGLCFILNIDGMGQLDYRDRE